MTDPQARDLCRAVVQMDHLLRGADERERSSALAYLAGVLRGVGRGTTSVQAATATVAAYRPGRLDLAAEAGDPPLVTRPHDWPHDR